MTNYTSYPKHRLIKNSCIICFSYDRYSWTYLSDAQKKYLSTHYVDGAYKIVVRLWSGVIHNMSVEEFRTWINDGSLPVPKDPPEKVYSKDCCQVCGKPMILCVRKVDGIKFWGCSAFPQCRFCMNYDEKNNVNDDTLLSQDILD